jgi:Tfp pilus assembly protein PilX
MERHPPSNPAPDRGEARGFVIVGVVMFVVALTILGFSLFGLSGYEAQFTQNSIDSEKAFFAACGGIEHAKFVLAKTKSLGQVANAALFPDSSIVYARARRLDNGDTTGNLGNAQPEIEIRVLATANGERRMLQTRYLPVQAANVYKRLMTVPDGVFVNGILDLGPPGPPDSTALCLPLGFLQRVQLGGDVVQSVADVSWKDCVSFEPGYGGTVEPGLPVPDLGSFFATYWGTAKDVPDPGGSAIYTLSNGTTIPGGPADVQFFRTVQFDNPGAPDPDAFSVWPLNACTIDITGTGPSGTAIWLLDHGLRADVDVDVVGGADNCLVIVSKRCNYTDDGNGNDRSNIGIWFFGGFQEAVVPTILVSDGQVADTHYYNYDNGSRAEYVSIFARDAWLSGPPGGFPAEPPPFSDRLLIRHPSGHPFDAPNGRIDRLCEIGALPNSDTGGIRFTRVAGTWKELDPFAPGPGGL